MSDQPKPATGERGKDGIFNAANGILQSLNKPAGEWTEHYVENELKLSPLRIASAHNAALAACHSEIRELERSRERIGKQLAAERENNFTANFGIPQERDALLQQLDAERSKVQTLTEQMQKDFKRQLSDRDTTSRV
jgi:hypothetical protein